MSRKFDLPEIIPVFPLPKALLLPRARLPLHIFEPRYLAMIEDVMKSPERLIGMVQPKNQDALYTVGCAGRLTQFSETEDGRYMVTLTGVSRFKVRSEQNGFTPYRRVEADWSPFPKDRSGSEADANFDRDGFFELLERYLSGRGMSTDWETLNEAEDELLINSLSMMLNFDAEEKQVLLEAPSLEIRRETLTTLIEFSLHGGVDEDVLQ
jgi:Lon protease-like protein